eukprot:c13264_g2_i1 orf=3-194(-)
MQALKFAAICTLRCQKFEGTFLKTQVQITLNLCFFTHRDFFFVSLLGHSPSSLSSTHIALSLSL